MHMVRVTQCSDQWDVIVTRSERTDEDDLHLGLFVKPRLLCAHQVSIAHSGAAQPVHTCRRHARTHKPPVKIRSEG